jgi:hypothetical protein
MTIQVERAHGLEALGIVRAGHVHWNLSPAALYKQALCRGEAQMAAEGPLVARTGQHTGRSPNDKFVVREPQSEQHVHWGAVNRPIEEAKFDRVGAFTYSPQDGTHAAGMIDDVPEPVKRERLERLTELQRSITADRYESRIGAGSRVLVDRVDESGRTVGRLPWQADDVAGVTYLDEIVSPGEFADVAVEEVVDDYDFSATVVRRLDTVAPRPAPRAGRSLPMAATIGSYGR